MNHFSKTILGLVSLFTAAASQATLTEQISSGDNEIIIERKNADVSSELRFELWPNRDSITLLGVNKQLLHPAHQGKIGRIEITVKDAKGTRKFLSDSFSLYAGKENRAAYKDCVEKAIKASENAEGIRMILKKTSTGYYGDPKAKGDDGWAAFGAGSIKCETIPDDKTLTKDIEERNRRAQEETRHGSAE